MHLFKLLRIINKSVNWGKKITFNQLKYEHGLNTVISKQARFS